MREAEVPVTFQPSGGTVYVLEGTGLLEAAAGAGIALDQPCGGQGKCGKCRLLVSRGACQPSQAELDALSADELRAGFRLACQSSVRGPTFVDVPPTSLPASHQKILARSQQAPLAVADPVVHKQYVELPPPDRGDDDPDLLRLEEVIGPFEVGLELLREIPARLRQTNFRGTAVLVGGSLIDFEPQNTQSESFAVATDVGTTTLVAALLDFNSGSELTVASRLNPQTRFGDDVLSRIRHVRETSDGLRQLHETIIRAVDEMIGELVDRAGIRRERIYELTFSGNTTMQQLLCGVDPSSLGEVPFVPTAGRGPSLRAAGLGLHVHPQAKARLLPVIGGFVGGDTVSGILATSLAEAEGPTLLVDIGTNGEIALVAGGRLSAASTAAGPAFEGARISQGMRGGQGAIEKVIVDGRLRTNVIGNVPPVGLCGSALIDLAAELLRHRLLTPEGRLLSADELPDGVLPDLAQRLVQQDGQAAFLLASETETGSGRPILLTQRDVRELQLATGAIRAGIVVLLGRAGLRPEDLEAVWIAGGFGNFVRRSNAQRIGLLPWQIER
ncbi:MAG: ASKHA domain-containing protein, partial [Planctomycetota bacterium]